MLVIHKRLYVGKVPSLRHHCENPLNKWVTSCVATSGLRAALRQGFGLLMERFCLPTNAFLMKLSWKFSHVEFHLDFKAT